MGIQVYATIGSLVFISAVPNTDMYRMGAEQIKEHDWERKKDLQKPKITDSQSSWAWNFVFLFIYVYGCFACMYICAQCVCVCVCIQRSQINVSDPVELQLRMALSSWELNPSLLQERQVLLAAEPSL